ncbi:PilC/PilY family type IV pilus protein [Rhodoferax sp.]|uniref:PilC/PilY family type IV pilus protein n=2 Tax=Rhodoferax sp. TaxID=50421 RepID=UPI00273472B5|nr:PilC/PilY family type IV pilus protein [Rhodoferax sp.]MDP3190592.1 PilC/PilY family type IV pilus protein [Rhodoferax sp.]MDP3866678.1 PilC/PilY family type IV pilus protein [Rhodoferax sp.]
MKIFRTFLVCLTFGLLGFVSISQADDIDIYSDNAGNSGVPNVLFVMDTGANFSSSAASPCTAYSAAAGGGTPSLGDTAGGVEQCALVDSITALTDGAVNIGILVNNNNSFATDTRAASDAAFHETCMGTYGGCVIRKLTLMTPANKTNLINFIKSWKTSGSNSATEFNVKSGGDRTANTMQEAWAYYNGKVGMSGKNYGTSLLGSGCQKNFIIYVGNSLNNSGGPADGGSESPDNTINGLKSPQVAATADQKLKISETVTFKVQPTCGVNEIAATTSASNWSENWADEWARLMKQQDGAASLDGSQGITTYTVGVINNGTNTCKADYPALLSTMAKYGGGRYFQTGSASEVKTAFDTILNEIQAVNSVFSSASLPVSVNAQGTYLNQIFLGMFRPDSSANPRWVGNLKQYQFVLDGDDPKTAELKLGDSTGALAISSAGTGFITPGAISFWTQDSATDPDGLVTGGYFKNFRVGIDRPLGRDAYDSPDGELVERGGTAQQLRIENLTADFSATAGSASNPRRLYTYCPGGGTCQPALTNSENAFSDANNLISAGAFGDSTTLGINSIVRTGTTALVTTAGAHGFTAGATEVTISNVTQPEYNVTQIISTTPAADTFIITGLPDHPTTPAAGSYKISAAGSSPIAATLVRSSSLTGGSNSETVTVTTAGHFFAAGSTVAISGASPASYSGNWVIALPGGSCPVSTCFTYTIPVYPTATAANTYQAVIAPYSRTITSISNSGVANGTATVTTSAVHDFHVGQTVTVASTGSNTYNGTQVVSAVVNANQFRFTYNGNPPNGTINKGSVVPSTTAVTLGTISRAATTDTATAAVTGATAGWFGNAINGTKVVNITKKTGNAGNESAYVASNVTITCTNATCTTFTYPITVTPSTSITGTITAAIPSASSVTVAAGSITRSNATATVTGLTANLFGNAVGVTSSVDIAVSGTAFSEETAYIGTKTITCTTANCSTATFTVTQTPTTPATGVNMQVFAGSTPPDKNTLVRWVRGQDNFGDEFGPKGSVTVRPSIHGDVLHSRPVVINYGDSRGLVVFYGANDGVFRAVNGSQTAALGSVPAGGELWGLVLPEHFDQLNRLRINSPELKLPTTQLSSALPKDYFVDGSPGLYQKLNGDGSINTAYLFLTMRRGGRFIYALDVTTPTAPVVLWRKSNDDAGFEELGQTWSRPRVTLVEGHANPVLVFGAGYDPAEDAEPPVAGTMGRGIFVVDAVTGVRIWSAAYTSGASACSGTTTQAACAVSGMKWAIPADIRFVDRDNNGKTDRLYAADVGGNVWRVDLEPTDGNTPDKWKVTKLAALGCATGVCASGVAPRKFFFPPNVVLVGATSTTGSYDAVMLGSGDREHPLKRTNLDGTTVAGSSYSVTNRFYVLKDTKTGKDATSPSASPVITEEATSLFDATSTTYAGTLNGFYITFATGEKAVNESVTVRGTTFFGTNKPTPPSVLSCNANLGEAKGYALDPFKGTLDFTVFDGGGLPPTPTVGIVTILIPAKDGEPATSVKRSFCVGCGGGGGDSSVGGDTKSALGAGDLSKPVPKNVRRTYWYKK